MVSAPWPGPPAAGTIGLVQLLGDVQSEWEGMVLGGNSNTAFDAIGRDIRDHMIGRPPDTRVQMGDISNGDANLDQNLLVQRFDIYNAWLGDYGLDFWTVAGNHDLPGPAGDVPMFTINEWVTYWGYPSHIFAQDMGEYRLIFFNPSGLGTEMSPLTGSHYPCRPFTISDVNTLETIVEQSTKPTIIMTHAQLATDAAIAEQQAIGGSWWRNCTSTVPSSLYAYEIREVIDTHPQIIGWCHGHTHGGFDTGDTNERLFNSGSRNIVMLDAGATYSRPAGSDIYREPVTFYFSILDDGKTIDMRWRNHDTRLWEGSVGLGRSIRLTAT